MYKACTHAKITTLSELMVNLHDGKATVERLMYGWFTRWRSRSGPYVLLSLSLSGGCYALSASKAIFRVRTYNCNLFSPVMMIT